MTTGWFRLFLAGLALLAAAPAAAEWHEASSDHFVIYADDREADIRRFAENLERYHSAIAALTGQKVEPPSPSNRVTIFVVGDQRDMRALTGGNRHVQGFYVPRAGASRAFVQEIRNQKGYPHFSTIVLLHEYAHHFFVSSSRFALPRWLGEGAAEFFAAATFETDGSLLIGRAALHRGPELLLADPVHVRELLDPALYEKQRKKGYDAFYGKSWLLYHYLTFSEARAGQLRQYERNINAGMTSLAAGEAAFGDLDALERELSAYMRSRMMTFVLGPDKLSTGRAITLRKLPPGEAAIMPLVIRSQRGVDEKQAAAILPEARAIAARHPDDPGVLAALAEAEYDAGNDAEAIAAADRALARDPARTNAYVQKGFALFRQAAKAEDKRAAYTAAMEPFTALNALENDHPLPLIHYYRSYAERGVPPPETARAALERASQLAPFDQGLQLNTAMMLVREGKLALAREYLAPLAANPHGGPLADRAKALGEILAKAPLEVRLDLPRVVQVTEAGGAAEDTAAATEPSD